LHHRFRALAGTFLKQRGYSIASTALAMLRTVLLWLLALATMLLMLCVRIGSITP
jgi:hypothetical protein